MSDKKKFLDSAGVSHLWGKTKEAIESATKNLAPVGSDGKISSQYLPSYVDDVVELQGFDETPITKMNLDLDDLEIHDAIQSTKLSSAQIESGSVDAIAIHYDSKLNLFWLDTLFDNGEGETQEIYLQWDAIENFPASSVLGTTFNTNVAQATSAIKPTANKVYTIGGNKLIGATQGFETGKIYVDIVTGICYRWGGTALIEISNPDEIYTPTNDVVAGVSVNNAVGAISAGTTMQSLKGLTFSQFMEKMLVSEKWNNPQYKHTHTLSQPTTPVKIGDAVSFPNENFSWNTNISVASGKTAEVTTSHTLTDSNGEVVTDWTKARSYSEAGDAVFKVTYSHPAGSYIVNSNLGNPKTYNVAAVTGGTEQKTVRVTAPVFINGTEKELVVLNSAKTWTLDLPVGANTVEVPFANSVVLIKNNFGAGLNENTQNWTKSTVEKTFGDYKVSYQKFTINFDNKIPSTITVTLKK